MAAPSTDELIVDANSLSKTYGTLVAVNNVDLAIDEGEIFGLIGPDGAGKTTIFHMLGGILKPTAGKLSVIGTSARQARLRIGYLTQQFSLYPDMSIEQNLRYASGLRSVPPQEFKQRKEQLLQLMDLSRFSERLASNLSGGMKQKLALCCALISRPRLLLLDEPTTGVDPVSRREFWDVLASIAAEGVTIAVATPYLDEAERCTRVALIHKGVIKQVGTPAELKANLNLDRLELQGPPLQRISELLHQNAAIQQSVVDVQEFGDRLDALVKNPQETATELSRAATAQQMDLSISKQEPTLENVFALLIKSSEPVVPELNFPFESTQSDAKKNSGKLQTAIQAVNLSKRFGNFAAVKNVSLKINHGEIYGLLGANGAGKTTTIKMLCGLLAPTAGTMILAGQGHDLRDPRLRQRLGYMSQKFTLYEDLTVLENLRFYGGVYQVEQRLMNARINWVLETCNLSGSENMVTGKLPGGFRQRLAFGATVLHQPSILFLDEPTSGVDPLARRQLWKLIREFARQGTAVLVTTHFLEEAEYCQQLGFMVAGEVVATGSPVEIKQSQPGHVLELRTNNNQTATQLLQSVLPKWQASIFGDAIHVVVENASQQEAAMAKLKGSFITIESERTIPFSLEDAFIGIVERSKLAEKAGSAA
jgi:ABC-2 type transport system ATP-binding protein